MNETGWILLSRKLLEWQWYDKSEMVHLWLHLLLTANIEDKKWHGMTINRGQLVTSVQGLSERLNISTWKIREGLNRLQTTGEVMIKTTNKYTLITICNYGIYQDYDPTKPQTNHNQTANKPQTNHNQTANKPQTNHNQTATTKQLNNKQDNNLSLSRAREETEILSFREGNADTSAYTPGDEEKEKNCAKKEKDFTPPTEEQVRQYCHGMAGLTLVNPKLFVAHYNSVDWQDQYGRPLHNWQALAVKWNEKEKQRQNQQQNGNRNNKQAGATRHASCEPRTDVRADEF